MKNKISNLLSSLVLISGVEKFDDCLQKKENFLLEIDEVRAKISDLTNLINSNRYFDEDTYLLDKKTVLTIQNKVKKLQNDQSLLKDDLRKVIEQENFFNKKIEIGKENVEKYTELLKNISYKLVDKNVNLEYYEHLMEKNSAKLDYWNVFVKNLIKQKDSMDVTSDVLKASKDQIEYEINNLKERIIEINHDLENDFNYINKALKEEDESKLDELNKKIALLEKEFSDFLISVEYLSYEFLDLIEKENYIYAHSKLSEIVWKIEYIPYALENNFENLAFKQKLMKKEKFELTEKIKTNDYFNEYSNSFKSRLKDLNFLLEENRKDIIVIKKLINHIDKQRTFSLSSKINDLDIPEEILANYNGDLNHLIEYSVILKNTSLKYLEKYRDKLNDEIEFITKKLISKDGFVDESRRLKDIETIKELATNIEFVDHRLKHKINVYEAKENIETLLNSLDFENFVVDIPIDNSSELVFYKVINVVNLDENVIDLTGVGNEG